jgi:integral membrane protein
MADGLLATRIGRLRVISVIEAVSFLILLTCSVLKRTNDWPLGVQIMGPVHGVLFITYVLGVLDLRKRMDWPNGIVARLIIAAVLPIAPLFVERWLRTQAEPVRV